MLTTPMPGAQAESMVDSAARPPSATPYPTEVGRATTGALICPATTVGRAPSIPAATTTQAASRSSGRRESRRCRPAIPMSASSRVGRPGWRAVSSASRATGRSLVPAQATTTRPPVGSGGVAGQASRRASASWEASGRASSTAAARAGSARVNSTGPRPSRPSARSRAYSPAIAPTCWMLLASHSTASGAPRRRARSRSRSRKPSIRPSAAPAPVPPAGSATPARSDDLQGEQPRADAVEIDRDVLEPGLLPGGDQGGADLGLHGAGELAGGQLDAADGAVVAHPAVGEALRVDGVLEVVDLAQLLGRDGLAEGDPGGEAGGGGLVRDGQRELPCDLAHLRLRHPEGGHRPQHAVPLRGPGTGTVVTGGIVGVLAVGDGVEPLRTDDVVADAGEQLVLAVEAPAPVVLPVVGVLALVGVHLDDLHTDHLRDLVGQAPFTAGERGGDAEQRDDVLRTERPHGEGEQGRGVDAAGVGDTEAPHTGELGGHGVGVLERLAGEPLRGHGGRLEPGMAGREQRGGGTGRGHLSCASAPSRSEARRNSTSPAWSITNVSGSCRSASMSREAGSMYRTLYASHSSGGMEVAK